MRVSTLFATGSAFILGSLAAALPNPQGIISAKQCGDLTIRYPSGRVGSDVLKPTNGCLDYTNHNDGEVIVGMTNYACYCGFVAEDNCGNGSPNGATITHMNWPEAYPVELKDTRSYSCVWIPGMGDVTAVQGLAQAE